MSSKKPCQECQNEVFRNLSLKSQCAPPVGKGGGMWVRVEEKGEEGRREEECVCVRLQLTESNFLENSSRIFLNLTKQNLRFSSYFSAFSPCIFLTSRSHSRAARYAPSEGDCSWPCRSLRSEPWRVPPWCFRKSPNQGNPPRRS